MTRHELTWHDRLPEFSFDALERLQVGTYQLSQTPTAEQLKSLLYYKDEKAEVGLVVVNRKWFVGLNEGMETIFPMHHFGLGKVFDFEMHTHPVMILNQDTHHCRVISTP